jgi:hypothetical protein
MSEVLHRLLQCDNRNDGMSGGDDDDTAKDFYSLKCMV